MTELLEKFKKVIEVGNITRASEELNISQPALTMSLNKLESILKANLLVRSKKGVYPTEIGKSVYKYANKIHSELDSMEREIRDIIDSKNQSINCGMIDHIAEYYLDPVFNKLGDNTKFNIHVNNSSNLIKLVEKGEVEFAIITMPNDQARYPGLKFELILEDELGLFGVESEVSQVKSIKDLNKVNLITYNEESNTYSDIDSQLKAHKVEPKYLSFSTSPHINAKLALRGRGVAVLPRVFVKNEKLSKLKEIRLPKLKLHRSICLVKSPNTYISPTAKEFIGAVRD